MTPKPSAQGTLARTPLEHLFLHLHGQRLTGTLALWPDDADSGVKGQDRLLFHEGHLVGIRPIEATGNMSIALTRLFHRVKAPYAFYEGHNLLGTGPGVLSDKPDLYRVLADGVRSNLREDALRVMLGRIQGQTVRIRPGIPLERLGLTQSERALIELMRAGPDTPERLGQMSGLPRSDAQRVFYLLTLISGIELTDQAGSPGSLPRRTIGDAPLATPPVTQAESRRPQLSGSGRATTGSGLRPPITISRAAPQVPLGSQAGSMPRTTWSQSSPPESGTPGLPNRISLRPRSARPVSTASAPPSTETVPPPPMPPNLDDAETARWRELTSLYLRLDSVNHFDLLGVGRNASQQEVSDAYFVAVKKFHPDRLCPALTPLQRCAQLLFDRLTEANETLTHPERREEYVRAVAEGGGTKAAERMMRHVLESALEFQKAEVLIKRRDYPQAFELVQSALSKSPDEPDYLAAHAWLTHILCPEASTQELLELVRQLDRALHFNDRNERAHFYKGVILKRMKRHREALRHFREAAELNPRNVEAAREVRLATMRRESKNPPSGGGGILSKFFGGKGSS